METIRNNEKLMAEIGRIAEVAGYLWTKGWAERNGGNISVNLTDLMSDVEKALPARCGAWFPNAVSLSRKVSVLFPMKSPERWIWHVPPSSNWKNMMSYSGKSMEFWQSVKT